MKTTEIKTTLIEYDVNDVLDKEASDLIRSAGEAMKSAYAPYSGFHVGAAVLLDNGQVVSGSNQENAAYPSGLCAERVALFSAGASHPGVAVKAIAITVHSDKNKNSSPAAPCGACRQVMAEFETNGKKNIRILMAGENGSVLEVKSVNELLPLMFKPENLL